MLPFPDALGYVWRWFIDLNGARGGGMGPSPITWPDMAAYFGLKQIQPEPWELDLIHSLDGVALTAAQDKPEEVKAEGPKLPQGKPHLRGKRKP